MALWPAAAATIERYGETALAMAQHFSPGRQSEMATDPDRCMTDESVPTISVAVNAYGHQGLVGWVMAHLEDCVQAAGVRDKVEAKTMVDTAEAIVTNYPFLRLSEVLLFFSRFKAGRYGRFYGVTDLMVVTTALSQYAEERSVDIRRIARAREHVAQLMNRMAVFGHAEFDIDELRQSPIWETTDPWWRRVLERIAAERDHPRGSWERYKFHVEERRRKQPDGTETRTYALMSRYHARDFQRFATEAKGGKTA